MIAAPFVYTAEELGQDLQGTMPPDVETQTTHAINHIRAILHEGGCTLADVVSVTVYVTDLANMKGLDSVYEKRMPKPYPVRSIVQTPIPNLPNQNPSLMAMLAIAIQP